MKTKSIKIGQIALESQRKKKNRVESIKLKVKGNENETKTMAIGKENHLS